MTRSVAIIADDGTLVDTTGANRETNVRYKKFAKRMQGESGTSSLLDYGWNGRSSLEISRGGDLGDSIVLKAAVVKVSNTLFVNDTSLASIIGTATDSAINGISGTSGKITVTKTENASGSPRISCVISLDDAFVNRLASVETSLAGLFRMEELYRLGDGLKLTNGETMRVLSVNLGTGLRFEDDYASSDSSSDEEVSYTAITIDTDSTPTQGSAKPVTSGGVYEAIASALGGSSYVMEKDSTTGNMKIYYNAPD